MKQTNLESISLAAFPANAEIAGFLACNIQWIDPETGKRKSLNVPVTRDNLSVIQTAQRALVMREVKR